MKYVITGMPEKKSTKEDKSTRHVTGLAGEIGRGEPFRTKQGVLLLPVSKQLQHASFLPVIADV